MQHKNINIQLIYVRTCNIIKPHININCNNLVVSLPGKTCIACLLLSFKYSKSRQTGSGHAADSKLRYTIQFSILILCAKYMKAGLCGSREKCDRNYLVKHICLWPQYSKSHRTGSGHATDSKLRYTIQFSILMLCAKYQEAGLCGSREKCDRNFLLSLQRKTTEVIPICRLR